MNNIEGEIWYPYTFDLGRNVTEFDKMIGKILDLEFVLAGFDSVDETFAYKENGLLVRSQFSSSEYGPENKFDFDNRPNNELKERAILFLGSCRLSEIHLFSGNYRRHFQYVRFSLSPIVFRVNLGQKDEYILLEPSLRITTTGVLTVTFRLNFSKRNLGDVIKLENLYSISLRGLALPSELLEINQTLAAFYHGVKFTSEVKKTLLEQIVPFEVGEGIKLCSVSAEGMRFEHIAENYKYLLIERLFLGRPFKRKDFHKLDRTSYWQCRPSVFIFKYDEQENRGSAILINRGETIAKLLNRVPDEVPRPQIEKLMNLRSLDDSLLFINKGLMLQIYGNDIVRKLEDQYEGKHLRSEKLWVNLGIRVIMDYVEVRYMNLKIWFQVLYSFNAISQKSLIRRMETKQEQDFYFETDYVLSGELQEVINHTKKVLLFGAIEGQIKKRIELMALKADLVRSSRVFWYGLLISVSFGLANLEQLSTLYFKPLFTSSNWSLGIEHPMLYSGLLLFTIIGLMALVIKRLTRL